MSAPWRLVASPKNPKGLAIGFLIGSGADAALAKALPGWAIVCRQDAPLSVTQSELQAARALGRCSAVTPVGLFGWSAGCQSVRAVLLSKLIDPWAVAVFDGTSAEVPPDAIPWKIQIWADLATRARAGGVRFLATCTQMAYTQKIPKGQPGRGWPTSWVLGRALGLGDQGLSVGAPIIDGKLYVEMFPSPGVPSTAADWAAAKQAHLDQVNIHAPRLLATWWGADTAPQAANKPPPAPEAWQDPSLTRGERLAAWAVNEWAQHYTEIPKGSNNSPRIEEYDREVPFTRRGEALHVSHVAWCAKMAGAGLFWSKFPNDLEIGLRVSGIEYELDAKATNPPTWIEVGKGSPTIGALAIFKRAGDEWFRHVTIVVGCTGDTIDTIGGNDNDAIGRHTIYITGSKRDPNLLGYVIV